MGLDMKGLRLLPSVGVVVFLLFKGLTGLYLLPYVLGLLLLIALEWKQTRWSLVLWSLGLLGFVVAAWFQMAVLRTALM